MKILADFPGLLLLPVATFFAIGSVKKNKLGFSKKCSVINMIVTMTMYGITLIIFYHRFKVPGLNLYNFFYGLLIPIILVSFIALVLNVVFLALDEKCCCNQSRSCVPQICCGPSCYDFTYYYINTTDDIFICQCDEKNEK